MKTRAAVWDRRLPKRFTPSDLPMYREVGKWARRTNDILLSCDHSVNVKGDKEKLPLWWKHIANLCDRLYEPDKLRMTWVCHDGFHSHCAGKLWSHPAYCQCVCHLMNGVPEGHSACEYKDKEEPDG